MVGQKGHLKGKVGRKRGGVGGEGEACSCTYWFAVSLCSRSSPLVLTRDEEQAKKGDGVKRGGWGRREGEGMGKEEQQHPQSGLRYRAAVAAKNI